MFAQIGSVVFEALSGFDRVDWQANAVVAQYGLLTGVPVPQQTGRELRTMNISMALHQRFIVVNNAVAQLRAYIENGMPVALVWGNGDNDGMWIITGLGVGYKETDGLGNVFCAGLTVGLLEVPSGNLLSAQQDSALKAAVGVSSNATPVAVAPAPYVPSGWEVWVKNMNAARRYAGQIEGLAYSGVTAGSAALLTLYMARAGVNAALLASSYDSWGVGFADIVDLTAVIGNVGVTLGALAAIDPVADYADFYAANVVYQNAVVVVFVKSFLLTARAACRMSRLIS